MLTGRAHPLPVVMLAFSIALGMSGCVAPTPDPTPSTSAAPSASPLFDSDEEALAAATEAYAAYQAALDRGFATWESDNLQDVAVDPALQTAVDDVAEYREQGRRQIGSVLAEKISFLGPDIRAGDEITQVYACLNVSQVDVVDSAGQSTVVPGRPERYPVVATFQWFADEGLFKVSDEEVWEGDNFCD